MGSGLILLLIVGAWLAVLVPMALRSYDTATAASTVDRFSDAMRVLSRRSAGLPAPVDDVPLVPPRPPRPPRRRPGPSAAARRRRVLVVLVVVAVAALVGAVVGPTWLWTVAAVADLMLIGFLGWLWSTAARGTGRHERPGLRGRAPTRRAAPARSPEPLPVPRTAELPPPAAVAAAPRREQALFDQELLAAPEELAVPEASAAPPVAASEPGTAPVPARGAQGEPWSPVPLPVPTYVTAARAPRRVVDLTVPAPIAAADQALTSAERSLGIDDRGPELEHILGRRAVGG